MALRPKFNTSKVSKDKTEQKIAELKKLTQGNSKVLVGLPEGSNPYPDGTSLILVGATHEFGSDDGNIPERSFLRSTIFANRRKYILTMRTLARKLILGKLTADKALNQLGQLASDDVKQTIVEIKIPPNTLSTIDKKGSSNPLIDTGHLRQSITYQVIK